MKIAIFTDSFLPNTNGNVSAVVNLSLALAKKGNNILIIAPKPKKKIKVNLHKRISIKFVPSMNAYFFEGMRFTLPFTPKLVLDMKKFGTQIIHFNAPFTLGFEAILCAKIMNLPLVGTYHNNIAEKECLKNVKLHNFTMAQKAAWKYSNFFYDCCDIVISPSLKLENILKRKLEKPVKLIHNAIDISKFKNIKQSKIERTKKKYNLGEASVLFIGRISPEKEIDQLIKAMDLVVEQVPKAKLIIVGSGPLLNNLKEKNKCKNITFTGKIKNDELIESGLIHSCALFATMSKVENQPITVLESMAAGLPIVGVDKMGVPELIKGNGFISPADDIVAFAKNIIRILENKNLREDFSKKSLILANNFASEKIAEETERLYASLQSNKSSENNSDQAIFSFLKKNLNKLYRNTYCQLRKNNNLLK